MSLQAASNVIPFPHCSAIDTLWWPSNAIAAGLSLVGRYRAEAWCKDLRAVGVANGEAVEFMCEEVLGRFSLAIQESGYSLQPAIIEVPRGASVTTDDGDSCDSIDEMISYCQELGVVRLYWCRVGIQSRVNMRMLRRSNGKFGLFYDGKAS
jgi:hypothetical protein